MFKSVRNSFHGREKLAEPMVNQNNQQVNVETSSTDTATIKSASGSISKTSGRKVLVKRSKKRLSSMMSSLRRAASSVNRHKEITRPGDVEVRNNFTDDDDDDDDAYKSAEEACRKLSLSERDQDDHCLSSTPINNINKERNNNSTSVTKTSTMPSDEKSAYDLLRRDSKYILPEEQCDIPTFLQTKNCDSYLIIETRRLLEERYAKNPDAFYDADYKRMLTDDWTVSRFLLRRRLDPKRTAKLMEECGRFRKQYKMSEVQLWEFPIEFHKAGGLFKYAPDRVGNVTLYMRVKMYRRVPEISDVFKAFILCVLEECDIANGGRGTAVIFDLSGCGLQNVDLGFLSWLLSSFRNYCPKGVSYILVYNLPWILNATCKLAMTWMSASNKRALRFVYGDEIENFICRSNLPDYLGGECKINYRAIPNGSKLAIDVCDRLDMTREQALKIRELFKEYLSDEDIATATNDDSKSFYDDAKSTIATEPDQQYQSTQIGNNNHNTSSIINSTTHMTHANGGGVNNNNNIGQTTNNPVDARNALVAARPVVDLMSRASKFIAH